MSADTFHSAVETKMKDREVYDWRDLLDLIRSALDRLTHPTKVLDLQARDFNEIPEAKEFCCCNLSVSKNSGECVKVYTFA